MQSRLHTARQTPVADAPNILCAIRGVVVIFRGVIRKLQDVSDMSRGTRWILCPGQKHSHAQVAYLLCSNISHRDLKLENLLLQRPASEHEVPAVKIADFGLAKKMAESQMRTICGTPQYVAPEVILVSASKLMKAGR